MYRSIFPARITVAWALLFYLVQAVCAGEAHTTKHLSIQESASPGQVKPGSRVTLMLDVELKPGMHVYAPGVQSDYIPIQWKMSEAPGATIDPAKFPAPENLYLQAIDETVPAYTGKFRITREIRISDKASAGALSLEGKFRYQACDDRLCYIPQTVPLTWSIKID